MKSLFLNILLGGVIIGILIFRLFRQPETNSPGHIKNKNIANNKFKESPYNEENGETIMYRIYTPKELAKYNGISDKKIFIAVKGTVYDVTPGKNFYGPMGPYKNFAGRDASRGLALSSFDPSVLTPLDQFVDDLHDLTEDQLKTLNEWETRFKSKYNIVGKLESNSKKRMMTDY